MSLPAKSATVTDHCLGCNLIESSAVTLLDGKNVCSSCPAWRLETEAREVLSKPLEARRYQAKLARVNTWIPPSPKVER